MNTVMVYYYGLLYYYPCKVMNFETSFDKKY